MVSALLLLVLALATHQLQLCWGTTNYAATAFVYPTTTASFVSRLNKIRRIDSSLIFMSLEEESDGVVELGEESTEIEEPSTTTTTAAPFLSQGEVSKEALNPDLSDPKQTRVIIYIILSLIPVLFLVPLMLGSRDLIPPEMLPPVEMS